MKRIIIAGGCFWGVEAYFKMLKGIVNTSVGYTNGNFLNPSYEDLTRGRATHVEAVELIYDEEVISLTEILEHMFRIIDPTSLNKQGGDIGIQYRTGIYYDTLSDKEIIDEFIKSKNELYKDEIKVEVEKENGYSFAEDYHQDYLDKNVGGYCHIDLNLLRDDERK